MTDKNKKYSFEMVPFEPNYEVGLDESDIKTISEAAELTEENTSALTTVFQAAVNARAKAIDEECQKHYEGQVEEIVESIHTDLTDEISGFLEKALNEWFEEKEQQIDESLKIDINAELVEGLQKLFKSSYVEVPENRRDLLDEMAEEIKTLEAENDILEESNQELDLKIKGQTCFNHIQI